MKLNEDQCWLECMCHEFDHILRFEIDEEDNHPPLLWAFNRLKWYEKFWKRVRVAFTYIFSPSKSFIRTEESIIGLHEAEQLRDFLQKYIDTWNSSPLIANHMKTEVKDAPNTEEK